MLDKSFVDDSEIQKNLQKFTQTVFPKALKDAMKNVCLKIEADAKENCPSVDGTLRSSITHQVEETDKGIVGFVGSNLEYAPYVHQGTGIYAINGDGRKEVPWCYKDEKTGEIVSTVGIKPVPFIQDAIDANQQQILSYFKDVLK